VSNPSTATSAYNYAYDPVGNRWTQTIPSTCSGCTGPQPSYNFDGKNRITTASGIYYDAAGNVINDGTHTYTYDAENRMITVDGSAQIYFYDAFSRQTQTIYGGNTYSRIFGLNSRAEVQFIGNSWMLSELYAGSVGEYLGNYSNNTTYFAHSDQVGSRGMYTGPSGSVVETCAGLPFGDGKNCTGSGPASPTAFTGQDGDPNTNLTRFLARNYSMQQGRWMHPDPAGLAAVDPGSPQTWNRYAYVGNNPLSFVDPLGLLDEPTCKALDGSSCGGGSSSDYTIKVDVSAPFDLIGLLGAIDSLNSFFEQSTQNSASQQATAFLSPWGGQRGRGEKGGNRQINKPFKRTFPCNKSAQQVMGAVQNDMGQFADNRGTVFSANFPVQPITMGGRYLIQPGLNSHDGGQLPMANLVVTVTSQSANGWTFTTDPSQHFFDGTVSFSSTDAGSGNITFSILVNANWVSPFTQYTIGPVILAGENSTWNNMLGNVQGYCQSPIGK
jgi:RHS repeat-associated protein